MSSNRCLLLDFDGVTASLAREDAQADIDRHRSSLLIDPTDLLDRMFYTNPYTVEIDTGLMSYEEMLDLEATVYWRGSSCDWKTLWRKIWQRYKFDPDVLGLLQRWKDINGNYLIISDNHREFRSWVANSTAAALIRENLLCSAEVGLTKATDGLFLLAAEKMGVSLEQCVLLDDSLENVRRARLLGLIAHVYASSSSRHTLELIRIDLGL